MCSRRRNPVQIKVTMAKGVTQPLRMNTPMKTMNHSTNIENITRAG